MTIKNHLYLLTLIFLFAQCATLKNATSGTFKDKRDGQTYKWVRLKDGKKWMAQNLNYELADSWCYDNEENNCVKYGRLYTWDAAVKACPKDWRLPTDDEWWAMTSHYGKALNFFDEQEPNQSIDAGKAAYKALFQGGDSRFSASLGGVRNSDNDFDYFGDRGKYWSSSEKNFSTAWYYNTFDYGDKALGRHTIYKRMGISCRCLQD